MRDISLQLSGFHFKLIGSIQKVFGEFPFSFNSFHVRVLFSSQHIGFNLTTTSHFT